MVQYSPTTDKTSERLAQQLARTHSYETLNNLLAGLLAAGDEWTTRDQCRVLQRALSLRASSDFYEACAACPLTAEDEQEMLSELQSTIHNTANDLQVTEDDGETS